LKEEANHGWNVEFRAGIHEHNGIPPPRETGGRSERLFTSESSPNPEVVKGLTIKADKTHGKTILNTRPRQKSRMTAKKRECGTREIWERFL
jgi:hypothetical protein